MPVLFKVYADFYYNFESAEMYDHIPCSFAYKLVWVDDEFTKPIVVFRSKNAASKFIEAILKEYDCCKKK